MSVSLLLATALVFTPVQPEPVKFDMQQIEQEIQQGLDFELAEIQKSFDSREIGTAVELVQVETKHTEPKRTQK